MTNPYGTGPDTSKVEPIYSASYDLARMSWCVFLDEGIYAVRLWRCRNEKTAKRLARFKNRRADTDSKEG